MAKVIAAAHAGTWYPKGAALVQAIDGAFANVPKRSPDAKPVKGIIVPHAGYRFCLATAAHCYAAIDPTRYTRAIVLGPSHHFYLSKVAVFNATSVETPFGPLNIDPAGMEMYNAHKEDFKLLDPDKMEPEHSTEMQFPLLHKVFGGNITVIPMLVGDIGDKLEKYSEYFRPLIEDPHTLLVMSSDFCHWGRDFRYTYLPPGDGAIYERIEENDREAMRAISTKDVNVVQEYFARTKNTICGRNPIQLGMASMPARYEVEWLHYSQSNHVTSPNDRSVSYSAGIFTLD